MHVGILSISKTVKLIIYIGVYGKIQKQELWLNAPLGDEQRAGLICKKSQLILKSQLEIKCKQMSCRFQTIFKCPLTLKEIS